MGENLMSLARSGGKFLKLYGDRKMMRSLPYDAEVEYLESTGTQWIDTGVVANGEFDAEYTISTPSSFSNFIVGGARSATQHLNFGQYEPDGKFLMAFLDSYWIALTTIAPNTTYTTKIHYASGSQTATVNGTVATGKSYSGTESLNLNIYLFKRNFYNASDTIQPMKGKMYSFKFWQNGTLVRDFIPVRVGSIGYLYDRVSGELLANQGTGAFVIGPDKERPLVLSKLFGDGKMMRSQPTARDYVQDGLIAMWDGIENAGWGVHNASATVWKDLVGGNELTVNNGTWKSDALQFDGGRAYNSSIPELVRAVESGEFTIEFGGMFDIREGIVYRNESAGFKIGGSPSGWWVSASTSTHGSSFWAKQNMLSEAFVIAYPRNYEARFGWDDAMTNHPSQSSIASGQLQAGIGARKCVAQYVGSGGECKTYVDLQFINAALVNLEATYKEYGFALGSYSNVSYMTFNFFRVYNRAMTAAELAANYAVDKARFNLP